jgi:hypothetical protein
MTKCDTALTPGCVVSLADIVMDEIEAGALARLARMAAFVVSFEVNNASTDRATIVPQASSDSIGEQAESYLGLAEQLGLRLTANTLRKVATLLQSGTATHAQLVGLMVELEGRFYEEMEGQSLFVMESDKVQYYNDSWPYGYDLGWLFPTTTQDVEEAAKCLALGRPTASVFHAMRVLEVGLYSLGAYLRIEDIEVNWEEAIRKIEKVINRVTNTGPGRRASTDERAAWQTKRQFCADAATQFRYCKDGWRNRTAHAGYMYTDEKAKQIFTAVGDFMKTLAEHYAEVDYDPTAIAVQPIMTDDAQDEPSETEG